MQNMCNKPKDYKAKERDYNTPTPPVGKKGKKKTVDPQFIPTTCQNLEHEVYGDTDNKLDHNGMHGHTSVVIATCKLKKKYGIETQLISVKQKLNKPRQSVDRVVKSTLKRKAQMRQPSLSTQKQGLFY